MKYWLYSDGNILGPYDPAELLAAPDFTEESLVCDEDSINDGHDDWKPASQVPEFAKILEPLAAAGQDTESASADNSGVLPEEKSETLSENLDTAFSDGDLPISGDSLPEMPGGGNDAETLSEIPRKHSLPDAADLLSDSVSRVGTDADLADSIYINQDGSLVADLSAEEISNAEEEKTAETVRIPGNDISDLEKILNSKEFSLEKYKSDSDFSADDDIFPFAPEEKNEIPSVSYSHKTEQQTPKDNDVFHMGIETASELSENYELPDSSRQPFIASEENDLPFDIAAASKDYYGSEKERSEPSMGDLLSSLQNVIGDDKEENKGADRPPEEISDFQKEISQSLGENDKKRNVKEELDSLRLEKDLLLGELSLNDLGQNDRKKRISDLIQTLKVNARKTGGKSIFDDDTMPGSQDLAFHSMAAVEKKDSPGKNFDEGFVQEAPETAVPSVAAESQLPAVEPEIDDSGATAIKTVAKPAKQPGGDYLPIYDVSGGNSGSNTRPPIYVYENPEREYGPASQGTVTKVTLADDFRSGQIDFNLDEEDEVLNLLPQQAGGMVYDFTALSGKPSKITAHGMRTSVYAVKNVAVSLDEGENKTSHYKPVLISEKKQKKTQAGESSAQRRNLKAKFSSESISSPEEEKTASVSSRDKAADSSLGISKITSSSLSRSGRRRKTPDISEHELRRQQYNEEEPIMQEVSPSKSQIAAQQNMQSDAGLFSMDDEDRLKRETYEAIAAGKDPSLFMAAEEGNEEQAASMMWDQSFNAENLLQAASIESIGKNSNVSGIIDDGNPFKAADIYSTPQQNVIADDFISDDGAVSGISAESGADSFLDISPSDISEDQGISDDFSDYYVDAVPNSASAVSSAVLSGDTMPDSAEMPGGVSEEEPSRQGNDVPNKGPKIIKGIPASLSSIHRSIRTTRRKMEEESGRDLVSGSDLDEMPDFNVQLSSIESDRLTIDNIAAAASSDGADSVKKSETQDLVPEENAEVSSDVNMPALEINPAPAAKTVSGTADSEKEKPPVSSQKTEIQDNFDEPPALQLGKLNKGESSSSALPEIELPAVSIKEEEPPAAKPSVFYYDPSGKKQNPGAAFVIPSSGQMNRGTAPDAGKNSADLMTVLSPRVKAEKPQASHTSYAGTEELQRRQTGTGRKLAVFALALVCLLLFGVLALFMLAGNKGQGQQGTFVAEKAPSAEADPMAGAIEDDKEGVPAQPQADADSVAQDNVQSVSQPETSSDNIQTPEQQEETTNVSLSSASSDKLSQAIQIVKNYKLSGGRGTISNWFANSFLTASSSNGDEWGATPLHADIYVVHYRLPRSRQDPLIYQFEVDLAAQSLLRGINNNAIDLLGTDNSRTARALPARNTYESDTPQRTSYSKKPESDGGSLIQKAKKKFSAPKKQYRKQPEIKQLPLPPAPKRHYSQAVPTGFEQPEEDSNEAFLKALESDEELF